MSTSYDLFYAVYVGNLRYQVETHPEQYRWPANEAPAVAVRTVYGLADRYREQRQRGNQGSMQSARHQTHLYGIARLLDG